MTEMVTLTLSRQDFLTALAALDLVGVTLGEFAAWGNQIYSDYDVRSDEPVELDVDSGPAANSAGKLEDVRNRLLGALQAADEEAKADELPENPTPQSVATLACQAVNQAVADPDNHSIHLATVSARLRELAILIERDQQADPEMLQMPWGNVRQP